MGENESAARHTQLDISSRQQSDVATRSGDKAPDIVAPAEANNPLLHVKELLLERRIYSALLIDDEFNTAGIRWDEVDTDSRSQFAADVDDDEEALSELSFLVGQNPFAESHVVSDELLQLLVRNESSLGALLPYVHRLLAGQIRNAGVPSHDLSRFCDILDRVGIRHEEIGEDSPLKHHNFDLLFMDWRLENSSTGFEPVKAAKEKVRRVLDSWPPNRHKPFVVLMSSRSVNVAQQNDFLHEARLLGGMFHFVPKAELADPVELCHFLAALALSWPAHQELQEFQEAVEAAAEEAKKSFCEATRQLRREDYTYIQSLSLQKEGHPLGDYMLWLYANYLGQLLRRNSVLRQHEKQMDAKKSLEVAPRLTAPSSTLANIYHEAVFDDVDDVGHHPRAEVTATSPIEEPYLELGDIFLCPGELDNDTLVEDAQGVEAKPEVPQSGGEGENSEGTVLPGILKGATNCQLVYMLISPACDLAFSPDVTDKRPFKRNLPLILLRGKLVPLMGSLAKDFDGIQTELFVYADETFRVCWDRRRFVSMAYKEFMRWKTAGITNGAGQSYKRVSRMKLPFVLEVQHEFTINLARIATPVAPPLATSVRAQVMYRDRNGLAQELTQVSDNIVSIVSYKSASKRVLQYRLSHQGWVTIHRAIEDTLKNRAYTLEKTHLSTLSTFLASYYSKLKLLNQPFEIGEQERVWPDLAPLGLARNKKIGEAFEKKNVSVFLNIIDSSPE
jgi:CheY-like chemotaxis protein